MKRVSLILLICMYSVASMGISMERFYCCGKLMTTGLALLQVSDRSCDNDDENPGCCKTESKIFKVSDSHMASDVIMQSPCLNDYLPIAYFKLISFASEPMDDVANASHAPPLHYGLSIYKLFSVYRI